MYPVDGIRSQIEWNTTLNVSDVPVSTETTKYLRKVRSSTYTLCSPLNNLADVYHCDHWCVHALLWNDASVHRL
jgi:hypothetical protein